jgi:putative flippase GtrA
MIRIVPRYLLVGLTCALMHIAIMIGCDALGLHYVAASLISFLIVIGFGFALHCYFTFSQPPSARSFLLYAAGMAMNFPVWIVLLFLFCDVAGLTVPIAAPLAMILLFVWNFAASHWAITGTLVRSAYQESDGRSPAKP